MLLVPRATIAFGLKGFLQELRDSSHPKIASVQDPLPVVTGDLGVQLPEGSQLTPSHVSMTCFGA